MKAITIWQPWASLIALGLKGYETRSWSTNYRGDIAIHAGKRSISGDGIPYAIYQWLRINRPDLSISCHWPLGAVIAVANLVTVQCIDEELIREISYFEYIAGDWTPGRYAWRFEDIRQFLKPIPATGKPGLWNWDENLEVIPGG